MNTFQTYKTKPEEVLAFQFIKQYYKDLVDLGVDFHINPIPVKIPNIPDAEAYWNYHTRKLFIYSKDRKTNNISYRIEVNDWILKEIIDEPKGSRIIYSVLTNEQFQKKYEIGK